MTGWFTFLAGVLGASGVAAGAFGAHGLRGRLDAAMMSAFETGVLYHLLHAVALLGVAWLAQRLPGPLTSAAGWLLVVGIVLFSGSLYVLALGGPRWLGPVTPLGGLALIAAWVLLAVAGARALTIAG